MPKSSIARVATSFTGAGRLGGVGAGSISSAVKQIAASASAKTWSLMDQKVKETELYRNDTVSEVENKIHEVQAAVNAAGVNNIE